MARRKKRRRDFEMVGAVIGRERTFAGLVQEAPEAVPARSWELAVGSRIAARARPTRLERGVLLVTAATAAWANELSLLSVPLVTQLRKLGIEVNELRFRVGSIEPPNRPSRRPTKVVPLPSPLSPPLARSLDHVDDPELKDAIERAARICLGYRALK
jgi:hypothetical protein